MFAPQNSSLLVQTPACRCRHHHYIRVLALITDCCRRFTTPSRLKYIPYTTHREFGQVLRETVAPPNVLQYRTEFSVYLHNAPHTGTSYPLAPPSSVQTCGATAQAELALATLRAAGDATYRYSLLTYCHNVLHSKPYTIHFDPAVAYTTDGIYLCVVDMCCLHVRLVPRNLDEYRKHDTALARRTQTTSPLEQYPSPSSAVIHRMRLTLHVTRWTSRGASRLAQSMSACLAKSDVVLRPVLCRDATVYITTDYGHA